MCAIAGLLTMRPDAEHHRLRALRMLSVILARGPDETRVTVEPGPRSSTVCLGVNRLKIVAPNHGSQPLESACGRFVTVFNGEIYNHAELKRMLSGRGIQFRGESDGEVIGPLYALGVEALGQLDGMFAFALWDRACGELVLGRDRCGIKPLYWARTAGALLFASELKAMTADPAIDLAFDVEAMAQMWACRFILPPRSPIRSVSKIVPGTVRIFDPHGDRQLRFWSEPPALAQDCEGFDALFPDAVRTTVAGRSSSVFVSGGIDSAAVAAEASRWADLTAVTTGYAPAVEEDETEAAAAVVAALGLPQEVTIIPAGSAMDRMGRLAWHVDEPIFTPVCLSTLAASAVASARGRIVHTGDGADELLVGYAHMRRLAAAPQTAEAERDYWRTLGWIADAARRDLQPDGFPQFRPSLAEAVPDLPAGTPLVELARRFEFRCKLPEYHLLRVDRLSMAHSLEARLPFLRNALVNWSLARPAALLAGEQPEKRCLRILAGRRLPPVVAERPKRKFSAPARLWLQSAPDAVREMLLDTDAEAVGLSRAGAERLLGRFAVDPRTHAGPLWGALLLAGWAHAFGGRGAVRTDPPSLPAPTATGIAT